MCNCMREMVEQMKEKMGYEYVLPPVEVISGRACLDFKVKETGKKKERNIPLLLTSCPFCGKPYDESKCMP